MNRAVVKCVLSGDTLVVRGKPVNGPPPEKILTLAGIAAPRLLNRNRGQVEEPFAFDAREFLRKKLVGQEVQFRVEYKVNAREFATVLLADGTDLAAALVAEGLARVPRKDEDRVAVEALVEAESVAQKEGRGVWSADAVELKKHTKPMKFQLERSVDEFFAANAGKQIDAIVEQVRDGSSLRVMLLPDMQMISLFISGIKCPQVKRDYPAATNATGDDTADSAATAAKPATASATTAAAAVSEPFAEEAKFFTESRLLQREVKIVLEAVYKESFIGSVIHPNGNIAEFLLAGGLATCLDASITGVFGGPQKLRDAERSAKEKRLRLWRGFVSKAGVMDVAEKEFDGICTRIWSGDTIVVQSAKTGKEYKITLSSIRQPKPKDPRESYYNGEAKEYLRSRLIGNKVHVTIEYIRPAQDNFEERTCGTVIYGTVNMAEALLNKGLAAVLRSRKDASDDRSRVYDDLLLAEEKAQKGKKGIFSDKEPPVSRLVDASENAVKARSYLPFYKRAGRMPAVVDYVLSASRLKVIISRENAKLTMVLGGVRCPKHARTQTDVAEPFGDEAMAFVSQKCLQHDVEVEVENVDKTGAFIGSIWLKGNVNLSALLLEEGLATIHGFSADQSPHSNILYAAENRAKAIKKNIWSIEQPTTEQLSAVEDDSPPVEELINIAVAEIFDGGHFAAQILGANTDKLETLMQELSVHCGGAAASTPVAYKPGDLICAKFEADGQWYRAKVKRFVPSEKKVEVVYVDYGNSEAVFTSKTRVMADKHTKLPAQAVDAHLSFIEVPSLEHDYGVEAAEYLSSLVKAPRLQANVDYRIGNTLYLTVFNPKAPKDYAASVNADLLRAGYAQVAKKIAKKFEGRAGDLKKYQDAARAQRKGMFEYGDFALGEEL